MLGMMHGVHAASLNDKLKGFLRGQANGILDWVVQNGADGVSNYIADLLAAEGETELADAVRLSGDALESLLSTAKDATACVGSVARAASFGSAAGFAGAAIVGGIAAFINPACKDAVVGILDAGEDLENAADAIADAYQEAQCGPSTMFMEDTVACIDACDSAAPGCFTWYMDHNCCLCKPYCDDDGLGSSPDPAASPSPSPSPAAGASYSPLPESSPATCGTFEYDTDYNGGDIIPVTTKWADTAVSAASPQDCCEACSLYSYCQAWTFTDASNCNERLPGAPGCCYLKKATDWVATSSPGMVSGTKQGQPAASCTYEFDTDLAGGDILNTDGSDTVVPTFSDADCCQSCARTPGCGAWTMTPPSNCADTLGPNIVGCCFLKYSSGWTRSGDPEGVKTSGVLLSAGRRRA